jgi:hypothetical protein
VEARKAAAAVASSERRGTGTTDASGAAVSGALDSPSSSNGELMSDLKRRLYPHQRGDSSSGSGSTSLIALGSPSSVLAQQLQSGRQQQRERGRTRQRDLLSHNSSDGLPVQAVALVLTPTDSPQHSQQQQRGRRAQRESSGLLVEALLPGAATSAGAASAAAAAPSEGSSAASKQQHYQAAAAASSDSDEFFRPMARARSFIEHTFGISPALWDRDRSASRDASREPAQRPATASSVPAATSGIGSFFSAASAATTAGTAAVGPLSTAAAASAGGSAALFGIGSSSRQDATAAASGAAVTPSASPPPHKSSPFRAPPTSPQRKKLGAHSFPAPLSPNATAGAGVSKCDAALLDIGTSSNGSSSSSSPLVSALRLLCDTQAVAAAQMVCRAWRQHTAPHSLSLLQEAAKLQVRGSVLGSVKGSVRGPVSITRCCNGQCCN